MEFSDLVINIHRVVSTIFVVLALILLVRCIRGWSFKKGYKVFDRRVAFYLLILLYIQLVLGLMLYFVLGNQSIGATSIEEATKQISLRFWALEHLIIMMFALFLSQLGWIFIRKARLDLNKHKNTLFYFGTSFLLILISTGIAIFWR